VRLWAGYVAASTEQWRMAARLFPGDTHLLTEYPPNIAVPFTLYMAESALRLGNTDTAKKLLSSLDTAALPADAAHLRAAAGYLRGELARQEGDFDAAMKHWRPVANGLDQLYHTKAALALA